MTTTERRAPAGTRDAGPVLRRAAELAAEFIDSLAERDVRVALAVSRIGNSYSRRPIHRVADFD